MLLKSGIREFYWPHTHFDQYLPWAFSAHLGLQGLSTKASRQFVY